MSFYLKQFSCDLKRVEMTCAVQARKKPGILAARMPRFNSFKNIQDTDVRREFFILTGDFH